MSNKKPEKKEAPTQEVAVVPEKKATKIVAPGIKRCTCKSDFQDKLYGKSMRAMNVKKDGTLRCTVCQKVGN